MRHQATSERPSTFYLNFVLSSMGCKTTALTAFHNHKHAHFLHCFLSSFRMSQEHKKGTFKAGCDAVPINKATVQSTEETSMHWHPTHKVRHWTQSFVNCLQSLVYCCIKPCLVDKATALTNRNDPLHLKFFSMSKPKPLLPNPSTGSHLAMPKYLRCSESLQQSPYVLWCCFPTAALKH